MKNLKDISLFMLDMDGTFYLGSQLLPGAREFLALCRAKGMHYTFLTNNSSKSADDYIQKLQGLGVEVASEEMFTSADATLLYLERHGFAKEILLVGTPSLQKQFLQQGYVLDAKNPKAVVLGFDTAIDYAKLTTLCDAVRSGLPYVATHPDLNCPVEDGYIPDIGAVIAFVKASAGREPDVVVGKPNAHIANAVAARWQLPLDKICMVGDRLYTDIALGKAGVCTALVLSGETSRDDLKESDVQPDWVFADLAEMAKILQKED